MLAARPSRAVDLIAFVAFFLVGIVIMKLISEACYHGRGTAPRLFGQNIL